MARCSDPSQDDPAVPSDPFRHVPVSFQGKFLMPKLQLAVSRRRAEPNWFLAQLPPREYRGFLGRLDDVVVEAGRVLYEPGHEMADVYFPLDAIVSVICCPSGARALEVAAVSREGFIGPALRNPITAITKLLVQRTGRVRSAPRKTMRQLLERSPTARELAARCQQATIDQVMLCAACNLGHSPRQRCARWFLMLHDRVDGDEFLVTQEFLAYMLAMARQTVSGVATELQQRGSIEYSRGRVRITDREALEQLACPCYGSIRTRLQEILS